MLITSSNYGIKNAKTAKEPVYIAEIIFAGGGAGTPGVNNIYFTTADIGNILNFPYPTRWYPFLQADSISGISQSVDPINGVSTIGTLTVKLTDHSGTVSDIIKAADVAGYGLRRQRMIVYIMYKGMDWADKIRVRTMQIDDLRLSSQNEYTLSAADIQIQLRKTIFSPAKTTNSLVLAASGAITVTVPDTRLFKSTVSTTYATAGFIKIEDEIMRWDTSTGTTFNIPSAGRGMFSTVPAAHAIGKSVDEIIYLDGNPITMALRVIQSSGVALTNGTYDNLPLTWGCNMKDVTEVDTAGWVQVGQLLTGLSAAGLASSGLQFEFIISKSFEAKKFIEDSILKIIGGYGFVRGDGSYSMRAYNDLSNALKDNAQEWLTVNNIVRWGDLTYNYKDLANEMWIDFDEVPKLSGKYVRAALFVDSVSQKKWGTAKQLKYVANGIQPTSVFVNQLYQRFQRVLTRYSRPPMKIPLTLLPKMHLLEIGDIVRITLPIRDLFTGLPLDRAFEVISTGLQTKTGEVTVTCIAQPERASLWFNGVGEIKTLAASPAAISILNGNTQQLTARAFDASGTQVRIPAITWVATGNCTVSATGLVTATAVGSGEVYAIVGTIKSLVVPVTITAAANTNPVASVSVSPSESQLSAGQVQQMTAVAKDVAGNKVDGITFSWLSSTPATATVPAGPTASADVTAVANGTTNITATSGVIVSPVVPITVALAVTPIFTPPKIADVAYQIGTQITTMGPVGGPHVIPNGYNFVAGDYWFDGDVSLALGSTCTINGTVRLFSLGVVTISGVVDGVGRGAAGAAAIIINLSGGGGANGASTSVTGFIGAGGYGGNVIRKSPFNSNIVEANFTGGTVPVSLNTSIPTLTITGTAVDGTGSITALSGIPSVLLGSSAGSGAVQGAWYNSFTLPIGTYTSGYGGNSGAGLLIMARGIYISSGLINLSATNGGAGIATPNVGDYSWNISGGGGGGGGTFVALAEANIYGLPVMSIDSARIYSTAGLGGALSRDNTYDVSNNGANGTQGAFISQVIG